ncbi:MAG TPA: asparagine synthase (glutamine-hydrolyzing) [Rhodospirillaceae bacterium]|nr:asparagine synthase (glutamine-hydrolyzing) [Candidatus Neomarinimicrobiota bacterium]HCX13918.1 asparagine synthase (glutamine-hydrolyzing) [Rhodospirillaceae bacterium]
MCGISGVMMRDGRQLSAGILKKLGDALSHRGPDDRTELHRGDVGLVHTRLSIVDVEGGGQPFVLPDGTALIANGEIYNDPDLRCKFSTAGFMTQSDCESALHLYQARGQDFADSLRGMYALAVHDPEEKKLILARDPFGIKPLYYAETEASFSFASEPQALIAAELVASSLNVSVRDETLALQFSTGTSTVFENIKRLNPGETLVVQNGRITAQLKHSNVLCTDVITRSDSNSLSEFDHVWRESVAVHQRSDVPYGMFLSGGIDSAAVLAMMAQLNDAPVLAYTAAFPGTDAYDERESARGMAQSAGAHHVEVEISADDFWQTLPDIAAVVDDPTPDYAIIPTYLLARRAANDVKVVLTGEGGDEVFAGYGRYRAALRPWPFAKLPFRRSILAESGVLRAMPGTWRKGLNTLEYAVLQAQKKQLDNKNAVLCFRQAVDCAGWLPNDLLIKLDRCLMAFGVEGRVPFLDKRVTKFAFSLSADQKIRGGLGKWIVRQWLAVNFPAAASFGRKRGFTVPVADWIAAERLRLGPLVARQEGIAEMCIPGKVEALFSGVNKMSGQAAWVLLFYALWHRRHILGLIPEGDVFETLSV